MPIGPTSFLALVQDHDEFHNKSVKRIGPILLIGIDLLLVFNAGIWIYFNDLVAHPSAVALPDQIAGLDLAEFKTGANARTEFSNLHGRQFPIVSGVIGTYGHEQITVWAAGAPLNFIATRMVGAMREKILQGGLPFTPVEQFDQDGRTVYVLEGMDQTHYYFQSNNLVIWLAAEPALAESAIQQILEEYP